MNRALRPEAAATQVGRMAGACGSSQQAAGTGSRFVVQGSAPDVTGEGDT